MASFHIGMNKKIRILSRNEGDAEDPFDENYLMLTKRKYGESALDNVDNNVTSAAFSALGDEKEDDLGLDVGCESGPGLANEKEILTNRLMGIDQAIKLCIDRCDSEEMKRRMYSCILVVGGGLSSFPGARQWLERLISMQLASQYKLDELTPVEVITRAKDMDPKLVTWKGAAVMSLLDTANEVWFDLSDWDRLGVRVLRERAAFIW